MRPRIAVGNVVANNKDEFKDQLKDQINPIPRSGNSLPGSMGVISLKNGGKAVKPKMKSAAPAKGKLPAPSSAKKSAVKQALAADMKTDAKMAKGLGMKTSGAGAGRSTPGTMGLPFKSGGRVKK